MIGYGTDLIVRRQARDHDGDRTGPVVDTIYPGWLIAPAVASESATGTRDYTTDQLQAYGGPPDLDLGPDDRVRLSCDDPSKPSRWQVVGHPQMWSGFGWAAGRVVVLQRVQG